LDFEGSFIGNADFRNFAVSFERTTALQLKTSRKFHGLQPGQSQRWMTQHFSHLLSIIFKLKNKSLLGSRESFTHELNKEEE
jgi:hypothetical protein